MTSFADVALIRDLQARVAALEQALAPAQPGIDLKAEIQALKMRLGGLQGQINALKGRAAPLPVVLPDGQSSSNAA